MSREQSRNKGYNKERGAGWFAKWFLFGLALSAVLAYLVVDLSNAKVARDNAERERQWQESRQSESP